MVTNYDFMPTLLSYLNLAEKMPRNPKSPGNDFSAEFSPAATFNQVGQHVFYEFEGSALHSHRTAGNTFIDIPTDRTNYTTWDRIPMNSTTWSTTTPQSARR